jgi:hypothetical protein
MYDRITQIDHTEGTVGKEQYLSVYRKLYERLNKIES